MPRAGREGKGKGGAEITRRHLSLGRDIDDRPKRAQLALVAMIAKLVRSADGALTPAQADADAREQFRAIKQAGAEQRRRHKEAKRARERRVDPPHRLVLAAAIRRHPLWRWGVEEPMRRLARDRVGRGPKASGRMATGLYSCISLLDEIEAENHHEDLVCFEPMKAWAMGLPAWRGWARYDKVLCGLSYSRTCKALFGWFRDLGERDPDTGYRERDPSRRDPGLLEGLLPERLNPEHFRKLNARAVLEYAAEHGLEEIAGTFSVDGLEVPIGQYDRQSVSLEDERLMAGELRGLADFGWHAGKPGRRGINVLALVWRPDDGLAARPKIVDWLVIPRSMREHQALENLIAGAYELYRELPGAPLIIERLALDSEFDVKRAVLPMVTRFGAYVAQVPRGADRPDPDDPDDDPAYTGEPSCPDPQCPRYGRPMAQLDLPDYLDIRRRLGHLNGDRRRGPVRLRLSRLAWPDHADEHVVHTRHGDIVLRRRPDGTRDDAVILAPGIDVLELIDGGLLAHGRARIRHKCKDEQALGVDGGVLRGCGREISRYVDDNARRHLALPIKNTHPARYELRRRLLADRNTSESKNASLEWEGLAGDSVDVAKWVRLPAHLHALVGGKILANTLAALVRIDGTLEATVAEAEALGLLEPPEPWPELLKAVLGVEGITGPSAEPHRTDRRAA